MGIKESLISLSDRVIPCFGLRFAGAVIASYLTTRERERVCVDAEAAHPLG